MCIVLKQIWIHFHEIFMIVLRGHSKSLNTVNCVSVSTLYEEWDAEK